MPACFNTWKAVSKGQCKPHFDIFKSGSWNCRSQRFLVAFSWCLFQFSQEPCSSCHSSVGQIPNEFPVLQTRTEGKKSFGIMTKKKKKSSKVVEPIPAWQVWGHRAAPGAHSLSRAGKPQWFIYKWGVHHAKAIIGVFRVVSTLSLQFLGLWAPRAIFRLLSHPLMGGTCPWVFYSSIILPFPPAWTEWIVLVNICSQVSWEKIRLDFVQNSPLTKK